MDLSQKRQIFKDAVVKSRMFALIDKPEQLALLSVIGTATDDQLNMMVVKFDADEKKLISLDKEIADAEAKKKLLEEQKKKFMADLQMNIKKDARESAKRAEEILQELKNV